MKIAYLTNAMLSEKTINDPLKIESEKGVLLEIFMTSGDYPYIIRDVEMGSHFAFSSLLELKQNIT